jgi:hypothetical protein
VAIIGLAGVLVLTTIPMVWAYVKLTKWLLTVDDDDHKQLLEHRTNQLVQLYQLVVLVAVIAEFWPGLANWVSTAVSSIPL